MFVAVIGAGLGRKGCAQLLHKYLITKYPEYHEADQQKLFGAPYLRPRRRAPPEAIGEPQNMPRQADDDADYSNPEDAANGQLKVEDQASGLASHFSEPNIIRDRSEEEEEKFQQAAAHSERRM